MRARWEDRWEGEADVPAEDGGDGTAKGGVCGGPREVRRDASVAANSSRIDILIAARLRAPGRVRSERCAKVVGVARDIGIVTALWLCPVP